MNLFNSKLKIRAKVLIQNLPAISVAVLGILSTLDAQAAGCVIGCLGGPPPPVVQTAEFPPCVSLGASPIPSNLSLPAVPSVDSLLTVMDMASGNGPSVTARMTAIVAKMFGTEAVYLGQSTNGAVRIAVAGQTISLYPFDASLQTQLGIGAFLTGENYLNVGTACGTLKVIPAITNMADFGAALATLGLNAQVGPTGVITTVVNGSQYALRPDYLVTQGEAFYTPSLAFGADGVLRFTDSAGRVQILRPAFLSPANLQSAINTEMNGVLTIQTDGSGVHALSSGQSLTLIPEMVLSPAANGLGSANWVHDTANRYSYRVDGSYQGLQTTKR